jgi:hypothetical protein
MNRRAVVQPRSAYKAEAARHRSADQRQRPLEVCEAVLCGASKLGPVLSGLRARRRPLHDSGKFLPQVSLH